MFSKIDIRNIDIKNIVGTRIYIFLIFLTLTSISAPVQAWSNGGYSTDINNPKYGTHDMILEKAINMLPPEMKNRININVAYYGSETPDCTGNIYCIGDVVKHHVYYHSNGSTQHDTGGLRAQSEYDIAKSYLKNGDIYNFSLHMGAMSHYISDVGVFGHTMGTNTDWGTETHHSDYENYVENNINSFSDISFDGRFDDMSAFDATLDLARETTFNSGVYTNVWMDDNYNWLDPNYVLRTKNLIGYTSNRVADVIYKLETETFSTKLHVFVLGTDDALWYRTFDSTSWSDWMSLGGILNTDPDTTTLNNQIYVFARGTDNALWYRSFDGTSWTGWTSLGGIINSAPGVSTWGNKLYVFARGTDNALWYRSFDGTSWTGWTNLGGIIGSGPGTS